MFFRLGDTLKKGYSKGQGSRGKGPERYNPYYRKGGAKWSKPGQQSRPAPKIYNKSTSETTTAGIQSAKGSPPPLIFINYPSSGSDDDESAQSAFTWDYPLGSIFNTNHCPIDSRRSPEVLQSQLGKQSQGTKSNLSTNHQCPTSNQRIGHRCYLNQPARS